MLSNYNNTEDANNAGINKAGGGKKQLFVVWLSKSLDAEKSAESALLLADKMNISISKIMHLLSKKSGPLSKPVSQDKAQKLHKVLSSVGVENEIIDVQTAKTRLLKKKSTVVSDINDEAENTVQDTTANKQDGIAKDIADENEDLADSKITLDLDEIVDKINAKAQEATAIKSNKKPAWRRFAIPALVLLSLALGISYLVSSFMPQINDFSKNLFSSVSASSATPEIKENLNPAELRKLPTADLLTLANAGASSAQYELALKYTDKKDYESAIKWLKPAAEKNHREAQFLLGLFYQYGHGLEQNSKQALQWYKKAAEQGVAEAQYRLGLMYLNGEGTVVDKDKAMDLLAAAGRQNYGDAILTLDNLNGNSFESNDIFSMAKSASPSQLVAMLEPDQDLNQKDEYGQTPLMYAASNNNAEAVQILINMGADTNSQSNDGWTALMFAARDNPENIKTLLINGADIEILSNNGQTALEIAMENYPDNAEEYFKVDEF